MRYKRRQNLLDLLFSCPIHRIYNIKNLPLVFFSIETISKCWNLGQSNGIIFWSKIYKTWGNIHTGNCSWKLSKKIQQLLRVTTTFQPWKHSFVFVKNLVFNEKRVVEKLCFYQKLTFCLNFSCFLIKKWQEPRKHL